MQRTCTEILDSNRRGETTFVDSLVGATAWVLLGDPGLGKTTVFKHLSAIENGHFINARSIDILSTADAHRTTLFIDGLDETRGVGSSSLKATIRKKLFDEKIERFRLSCRAADWDFPNNKDDFSAITPGTPIRVFALDPLSEEQAEEILFNHLQNQSKWNPHDFMQQARVQGLHGLLTNPQTLIMLANAMLGEEQWPDGKRGAYELACKQLLTEHSHTHNTSRYQASWLDEAGQLCAIYLLSNSASISINAIADAPSMALGELSITPEQATLWPQLLGHKLFTQIAPDQYTPVHRTVAEYLAARYLAKQLQKNRLTLTRLSAWLFASDGGIIANLRGLAGWLAALATEEVARNKLIQVDPQALLSYGDLSLLPKSAKTSLLRALEERPYRGYITAEAAAAYAPLVGNEMKGVVAEYFHTDERSTTNSEMVYLLCRALAQTAQIEGLIPSIEKIVRDITWDENARHAALKVLIHYRTDSLGKLLPLAQAIRDHQLEDTRGDMLGSLLVALYPAHISPQEVFQYFGLGMEGHTSGYDMFWHRLASKIEEQPATVASALADGLILWRKQQGVPYSRRYYDYRVDQMKSLIASAIAHSDASTPIKLLFEWFESCWDMMAPLHINDVEERKKIIDWANQHADLVQALIEHRYESATENYHSILYRFEGLPLPKNQQLWFFALAEKAYAAKKIDKAEFFLQESMSRFYFAPQDGNLSFEAMERWVEERAELQTCFKNLLQCEWEKDGGRSQQRELDKEHQKHKEERQQEFEEELRYLTNNLELVRSGKQLQALWHIAIKYAAKGGAHYMQLDPTGDQIFDAVQASVELKTTFKQGFINCFHALDESTIKQAIAAAKENKTLYVLMPAMLGAEHLATEQSGFLFALSKTQVRGLFTAYFLSLLKEPAWVKPLLNAHPDWIAEIWLEIALSHAKLKKSIPNLHDVAREDSYKFVAKQALPKLLNQYPIKNAETQMFDFAALLLGCWRYMEREELVIALKARLAKKSMNAPQRAYCLMIGFLLSPLHFETQITKLLGARQIDIAQLMSFLKAAGFPHSGEVDFAELTPQATAFCIRLFAPHSTPDRPIGAFMVSEIDTTRDFINLLITHLENDPSSEATNALQALGRDIKLGKWQSYFEYALPRQIERAREVHFTPATAIQIAMALIAKNPANHADLQAIAIDTLQELQNDIYGSELNHRDAFWEADKHRTEDQCRDEIARQLKNSLEASGILQVSEARQADRKRSDIQLRHISPQASGMRMPIEVKGDWNSELWTAPEHQLAKLYMNHPECNSLGIYLVLWTANLGKIKSSFRKAHPNEITPKTLDEFRNQMLNHMTQNLKCKGVELFVLDIAR